jgi:Aerotolerance regulator N-terminal
VTFGAMAAWQAWVLIAAASGLAAYLFLLKVRPRRVTVPSLLLWARVFNDTRELTLWERIRRAVSLVIAIAIALALALALVRPALSKIEGPSRAAGAPGGRTTIILDSSWSMLARSGSGGTRWSRAIAEARRLAATASGGAVALATTADGLVEGPTTDRALIESALDRLTPGGTGAAAWPNVGGSDAVYFITDGAIARPRDAGVVVRSVFESAANVGITAFDIRSSLSGIGGQAAGQAYLEVANFGPAQQVHVTLARGTASLLDRRFDMAAGETLRQSVPLDRGGEPAIRARVEAPGNALALDDEAFAWFDRARPLAVTVVGEQTAWLARLFAGNPDVTASFVRPAAYRPLQEEVVIFDRWAPRDPPERPALYFAPPSQGSWFGTAGAVEQKPRWVAAGSHPAIRGVDPYTLTIGHAQAYGSADLLPVARSAAGTPLVYVNKSPARPRLVLVAFGPGESNLTAAPAFPVLVGNALAWLSRPVDDGVRRAGLSSFDEAVARVTDPGGGAIPLARLPGEAIGVLRAPGLYTAEGAGSRATFAVNVSDPDVSNLTRTSIDAAGAALPGNAGGQRPWWLYCVVLAFAGILGEWWTWLRRITV